MADSGGSVDLKEEENNSSTQSEDNVKFRDPLLTGLEKDSDDDGMESLDLDASARSDITVSRSSSLIANFRLDDDLDGETKDLFVIVDNPEKHTGTIESYITFRVSTKTTRSQFDTSEYAVRRRYNDFLWLRQRLEENYQTHLVPPLPEKHTLKRMDRFSPEFLRVRQAALQKFLTRLADHPVLSFDKSFHVFLTAKAWEFQAHKKQGSGFISRVTDSLHNMGASYMMKNRPPEFMVMHEYIHTFGDKVSVMDRIASRIVKEQTELLGELNEWAPVYTLWSNSEEQLSDTLVQMSRTIESTCQILKDIIDSTDDQLLQPVKEYILYTECIKAVLRRRDAMQMEYDMIVEELNKKKDEREHVKISDQTYSIGAFLGKDPEDVKQQKQDRLEQQIADLQRQMEMLNDRTVVANADLKADMERWHKTKQRDMKDNLVNMADRQIQYYEKCLAAWEDAIRAIQTPRETITIPDDNLQKTEDTDNVCADTT
ncbi:sorting nexin-30-like [Haliotis rufescens]|uniref:sorting nexin-30-like n=1 Tax=Haliotis rufescens TaxID=6454 RepID=UPI001EB065A4|nr:sorting nexin-30-like [Haliotis rufescens]